MISIAHNIAAFESGLSDLARRQLPFATALALNDTAQDVDGAWKVHLRRRLDRPTPFTMRGTYKRRASKGRLTAHIGFKDKQAQYLRLQATGGVRRPLGGALVVPVGLRLNKYGNMARGGLARLKRKPDVFVGKVKGRGGFYRRPSKAQRKRDKGPILVASFETRASYNKRLDLQPIAERKARAMFPRHFTTRFLAALATAK